MTIGVVTMMTCQADTGSALGNVPVCTRPATHTVWADGAPRGRWCREHARTARYTMFGYRGDAAYAQVTVAPLPPTEHRGLAPAVDGLDVGARR